MKIKGLFWKSKIKELNETNSSIPDINKKTIEEIEFANQEEITQISEEKTKKANKTTKTKNNTKHYQGHRMRLKEKILKHGPQHLKDYELLEAVLTFAIPRSDVKPLAKNLLEKYKQLSCIITAENQSLESVKGVGESTKYFFKLIHEIACRLTNEEIQEQVLLDNIEKVINYCKMRMANLPFEEFRVLFLNRKNKLIADEALQSGTIDKAAIFPREVVKKAIEVGAGAIILVHNHPSGDPTPSKADIETTINIQKAAGLMEIYLYDHIIIGRNKHYSMRANNFKI